MPAFPMSPDDDVLRVHCRPVRLPDGTPAAVVHLYGEIDTDTTATLTAALLPVVDQYPLVSCDLGGLRFFGAAGVNALAEAGRRAATRGHRLELCNARGLTRRVLTIAGLDRVLPVSE
ncbi:STAS domain-containing protein [Actinoplanes sp. NPDC024001]|uniref:STAS domain-containing protein n=1 Tax=Actinoplanes sp. NPDC024001 TaxID=3154598 RepID=UPI0033E433FA